jgi:hypothetical protein
MIFLAPSAIHGVGVFTDAPIPKGALPDLWLPDDLVFVPKQEARGASYACIASKPRMATGARATSGACLSAGI